MAHVTPLERADLSGLEEALELIEGRMGFLPNSVLTMAYRPQIAAGLVSLAHAVRGGTLPPVLKELIALIASTAAGCRYCQAHTASNAARAGAAADKIAEVWDYESSDLFSDAERAALRVAHHAALVPNQSTSEDFDELRRYYDDGEIVEIVATVALFGFLNRWNDTRATALEERPRSVASETLSRGGWDPGKHAEPPE
jgi:uncharacterized peroxidase-related enzyme